MGDVGEAQFLGYLEEGEIWPVFVCENAVKLERGDAGLEQPDLLVPAGTLLALALLDPALSD